MPGDTKGVLSRQFQLHELEKYNAMIAQIEEDL